MSSARERQKKRRQRKEMARRVEGSVKQAVPGDGFQIPAVVRNINIPGGRWWLIGLLALLIVGGVTLSLGLLNPPDTEEASSAIWLNDSWTYTINDPAGLNALAERLQQNQVGTVFAYVSSLKTDTTWSGRETGRNRFSDVEDQLAQFVQAMRTVAPDVEIYAWVEVVASTPDGYRLDNLQLQNTVASFSSRMVTELDFDGVLLDVKPIFSDNDDYLDLVNAVRARIGLERSLALAVAPDLTPQDAGITVSDVIAPGTMWSDEYKQRIALKADMLVINAFNSYLSQPVDYIEWVTYQVDAYVDALQVVEGETALLISVPNYAPNPPAHQEGVETLSAGLDGVRRGLIGLDDDTRPFVDGIAIYTDAPLTADDWQLVRDKWGNR
jgi:hypothetical protein